MDSDLYADCLQGRFAVVRGTRPIFTLYLLRSPLQAVMVNPSGVWLISPVPCRVAWSRGLCVPIAPQQTSLLRG